MSEPPTRPLDLTERLQAAFALQPEPRKVFAWQFLDTRVREGSLSRRNYKPLAEVVRYITYIANRLFSSDWTIPEREYRAINSFASVVEERCKPFTAHADEQISRAMIVSRGLPKLQRSSEAGLTEALLQWSGSLSTLYQPCKDDAKMLSHISQHYFEVVYVPFLEQLRIDPEHPRTKLFETLQGMDRELFLMGDTATKSYKAMSRMCKRYEEGCKWLDLMSDPNSTEGSLASSTDSEKVEAAPIQREYDYQAAIKTAAAAVLTAAAATAPAIVPATVPATAGDGTSVQDPRITNKPNSMQHDEQTHVKSRVRRHTEPSISICNAINTLHLSKRAKTVGDEEDPSSVAANTTSSARSFSARKQRPRNIVEML